MEDLGILLFFFLLHLYSIDICNGWKINVSDVPVNVNKIKPILKGKKNKTIFLHVLRGCCAGGEHRASCRCSGFVVGGD